MLKTEVFYSGYLIQTVLNSVYTPMYLLRTFMLSFNFHYNKSFPFDFGFLRLSYIPRIHDGLYSVYTTRKITSMLYVASCDQLRWLERVFITILPHWSPESFCREMSMTGLANRTSITIITARYQKQCSYKKCYRKKEILSTDVRHSDVILTLGPNEL